MKIWNLFGLVLVFILLTGCQSNKKTSQTSDFNDVYKKCLEQYEEQSEQNGGNGGFVDPKTLCQNQIAPAEKKKEYIISFHEEIEQDIVIQAGGTINERLDSIQAVLADLTDEQVVALKKNPSIKYVEENQTVTILN